MRYSDDELEALLTNIESDLAERKETWTGDAPEKGRQAACAFANDLPEHRKSGVLFVGAKDDGTPIGFGAKDADELLRTLADIRTDGQILPPPSLIVEKRRIKGVDLAVVTVLPADAPPVRYKGRIWIRLGPRRGIATAQDERILNERRRYREVPFDVQPVTSATLESLSRVSFEEEYLTNAFAADILAANEQSYEQRLAACKMIAAFDLPAPTVLGLLVVGKAPRDWLAGAYVQFLRINGSEWSDQLIDEATIDGPIAQVLRRLDEKLDAHNRTEVDIASENTERRTSPYPRVALQQLARNAIMHRSYENTNTPVRVYWFNDRIEIHNPGGPFGSVTVENFGRPGVTDYRNPNLADAMKVLGFVQRFGVGIATAQAELQRNGNPPAEFHVEPSNVLVTIRKKT
ncbi:MAG: putative DNA binding domain-containing protein [Verrucomicrobia bacterium]|nr:putative DNA binding domain-containing protein [Verrucomicrobiota bacterium]MDE3099558.1 putative DNA binding domain-containing protein [Verrucomicrobiota bacterium]